MFVLGILWVSFDFVTIFALVEMFWYNFVIYKRHQLPFDFVSDRCIHVVMDDIGSTTYPFNACVPQGSVTNSTVVEHSRYTITQNPIYMLADGSILL